MEPGSSVTLVSTWIVENTYLCSSQWPVPNRLPKDSLKLLDVHQECLKHAWLHDNRLGESIFLTACLAKRLFSLFTMYVDLKFSAVVKAAVTIKQNMREKFMFSEHFCQPVFLLFYLLWCLHLLGKVTVRTCRLFGYKLASNGLNGILSHLKEPIFF